MKVIEVKNVSKKFEITHKKRDTLKENFVGFLRRDNNKKEVIWALKNVTFDVERGECIGIVGENASGKTTLLKIIGKIMKPSRGEVIVREKVAPLLTLGVGFDPELTAKENVYLYGSLMGLSQKQIDEKYENIVRFSELEDFMDTKLKNFSSGMAVRLGFATAINVEADILLVDEVLSVGDGAFQKKCLDKFEEFKREGKTILYVSHGLDSIREHCDKVIFLHKGKLKAFGETEKVIELYERHLINKQLKAYNANILRKIKEENRPIYINDLKIFNDNKEECYVLDSGKPFYLLTRPINFPNNTIFTVTIYKKEGKITLFSKNVKKNTLMFKLQSLPLLEGTYEISIGDLGNENVVNPHKFKFLVKYKEDPTLPSKIFVETPLNLDEEVLSFGDDCENIFENLENGKTLVCFGDLDEAVKNSNKGAFFLNKKLIFSGPATDVVNMYNNRVYKETIKQLKLQI